MLGATSNALLERYARDVNTSDRSIVTTLCELDARIVITIFLLISIVTAEDSQKMSSDEVLTQVSSLVELKTYHCANAARALDEDPYTSWI